MRQGGLKLLTLVVALTAISCGAPPAGGSIGETRAQAPTASVGTKRAVIVIRGEPFNMSRDMAAVSSTGSVTGAAEVSMLMSSSLADIVDGTTIAGLILAEQAPTLDNGL